MKTAISLSDTLFEKAEQTAAYMGVPRSRLFTLALEEYLSKYNGEMITKKLNEVYEKINQNDFFNNSKINTTIVIPLITNMVLADAPGNIVLTKNESKLKKDFVIILSQIEVIDRQRLIEKIIKIQELPKMVQDVFEHLAPLPFNFFIRAEGFNTPPFRAVKRY